MQNQRPTPPRPTNNLSTPPLSKPTTAIPQTIYRPSSTISTSTQTTPAVTPARPKIERKSIISPNVQPTSTSSTSSSNNISTPSIAKQESETFWMNAAYKVSIAAQSVGVGYRLYQNFDLVQRNPINGFALTLAPLISSLAPIIANRIPSSVNYPIIKSGVETVLKLPSEYISFSEDFIGYSTRIIVEVVWARCTNTSNFCLSTCGNLLSLGATYIVNSYIQAENIINDNGESVVSTRDLSNYILSGVTQKIDDMNYHFTCYRHKIKMARAGSGSGAGDPPPPPRVPIIGGHPENHFFKSLKELFDNCSGYIKDDWYKKSWLAGVERFLLDKFDTNNTTSINTNVISTPSVIDSSLLERIKNALSAEELVLRVCLRRYLDQHDRYKQEIAETSIAYDYKRQTLYNEWLRNQKEIIRVIIEQEIIKNKIMQVNNSHQQMQIDDELEKIKNQAIEIRDLCLLNPGKIADTLTIYHFNINSRDKFVTFLVALQNEIQEYQRLLDESKQPLTPSVMAEIQAMKDAEKAIYVSVRDLRFIDSSNLLKNNFGFMGYFAGTLVAGLIKGEILSKEYGVFLKNTISAMTNYVVSRHVNINAELGNINHKFQAWMNKMNEIMLVHFNDMNELSWKFHLNKDPQVREQLKLKIENMSREVELLGNVYSDLGIQKDVVNECFKACQHTVEFFMNDIILKLNSNNSSCWFLVRNTSTCFGIANILKSASPGESYLVRRALI